jgi:GT2 family glycosyltransferase
LVFAGSHPVPPAGERVFLWDHWFVPFLQAPSISHLGSAHLIARRETCERLGGFDARLTTGEDSDFCARLVALGGTLRVEPHLVVEHEGFPRTLGSFMRRERWHGRGHAGSLRKVRASKVAIFSLSFAGAVLLAVLAAIAGERDIAAVSGALALALVAAAAVKRFSFAGPQAVLLGALVFPFYFVARAAAVLGGLVPQRD